jgi:O-antigen/teichoic acid export membrane protein
LQDDVKGIGLLYLRAIKITSLMVIPVCIGGACLGDLVISVVLGAKWEPMIFIFRLICIAEMVNGLNAINGFIHPASGHPKRSLCFQAICVVTMPISYAVVVPYGLNAIVFPALVTGTLISTGWIIFTLYKFKIPIAEYVAHLKSAVFSCAVMAAWILLFRLVCGSHFAKPLLLIMAAGTASMVYCVCVWLTEREFLLKILELIRAKSKPV